MRVRPLTLAERGVGIPTVSLAELLTGAHAPVAGRTEVTLIDYANEIIDSGFPGLRGYGGRALRSQLDGYVDRLIEHDFPEMGRPVRNPAALRRWMTAYASMISSTASFETVRDATTGGHNEKPARSTVQAYTDILERLWILEPVAPWLPQKNYVSRLGAAPKHQMRTDAATARPSFLSPFSDHSPPAERSYSCD